MENAVKALYIAAGVLIAIMVLSLGVALFAELQSYVDSEHDRNRFNELNAFNTQFTKYINYMNGVPEEGKKLTIQDIVSVAGLAYENNFSYNVNLMEWEERPNLMYVAIYLNGRRIDLNIKSEMTNLLESGKNKFYKCEDNDVNYSDITGRIFRVDFFDE